VSQEDIEALRRGFETFNREGVEAILDLVDPEFVVTTPPEIAVEPDTYRGHEGLRRYFASFDEIMDEVRFEPDGFIDAGSKVVVPFTLRAKGKGTGIEAEQRAVQVWTLRDGKAIAAEVFADMATARRAAGLEP
jgi:ketosteroid isomerase-like protein